MELPKGRLFCRCQIGEVHTSPFLHEWGFMLKRSNLHIDEIGNQDLSEGCYLIAVVLHEHGTEIEDSIVRYEARLSEAGLADVPFRGNDFLHGNEGFASVSSGDRKRLLT